MVVGDKVVCKKDTFKLIKYGKLYSVIGFSAIGRVLVMYAETGAKYSTSYPKDAFIVVPDHVFKSGDLIHFHKSPKRQYVFDSYDIHDRSRFRLRNNGILVSQPYSVKAIKPVHMGYSIF